MAKPFKDREEVKADIRNCNYVGGTVTLLSIILAVVGVIGDALNITLIFEPTSWLLLAIVVGLAAIGPHMNQVMAKHLFGIESEKKE